MNTINLTELLSHNAVKGTAVLLVSLFLGLALRRMAASRRYALWITSIAVLAAMPIAMWILPAWRVLPQTVTEQEWKFPEPDWAPANEAVTANSESDQGIPTVAIQTSPSSPIESAQTPAALSVTWSDVIQRLPTLWMAIAVLFLLRLGWSAHRLRRLGAKLPRGECALVATLASEMGLKKTPQLLIGPQDSVPMVWGVLRPRLLLPSGFESWSSDKQRGVLLHELAHLRRRDPLALWVAQWVKALHWFNPLAWLTLRQLRADQERACDDSVLRHGVRASDYAQYLLDLSRNTRIAPGLALCALTITRTAPVESRVRAILDPHRSRRQITGPWLAGLTIFALLILLPVAMLQAIDGPRLRGRLLDRNGIVLAESTKEKTRVYPLKLLAAHVIGYTGKAAAKDPRPIGRTAMEKMQNDTLARGEDVSLSLDARIQDLAIRAMTEGGITRGAAVVLDPRTGEILAAVSLPSYDPNVFIPTIRFSDWDQYVKDGNTPLFDRCFSGQYTPGSAYFPFLALAGIAAGVGDNRFVCDGQVQYGSSSFRCWTSTQNGGRHGELGLAEALEKSCNCFAYQFGNAAGIEQIEKMGQKLGFGIRYGVTDDEKAGILPGPTWLSERHPEQKWSSKHTANISIGQGFVLTTPLQLAILAATVGNGGKVPQPSLLKVTATTRWRADLPAEGLPASQIEQVREGMRLIVNGTAGTGKAAKSDKVTIAGKTGTAQYWKKGADGATVTDNRTWFIGFAPYENPTLAFAILKEGGKSGGRDCAPIAKRIVEEALALPADGSGEVLPVEDDASRAKTQFDTKAEALKEEVKRIQPDKATGFALHEFSVHRGEVLIRGVASGMVQALQFRHDLLSIHWEDPLEWTFPVPETMADGNRVGFQMVGVLSLQGKHEVADVTPR